jgi:hypothetical protein
MANGFGAAEKAHVTSDLVCSGGAGGGAGRGGGEHALGGGGGAGRDEEGDRRGLGVMPMAQLACGFEGEALLPKLQPLTISPHLSAPSPYLLPDAAAAGRCERTKGESKGGGGGCHAQEGDKGGGREGDSTSSTGDDPETCELSSRLEFAHQIAPVALLADALLALRQGPQAPHPSPDAEKKNAERIDVSNLLG